MNLDSERVPVHAGAFMPVRDIGKPMGGFYLKHSKYIHGPIVPPTGRLRNHFLKASA